MRRALIMSVLVCSLAGCKTFFRSVGTVGLTLSMVRSPLIFHSDEVNAPIDAGDRDQLAGIEAEVELTGLRAGVFPHHSAVDDERVADPSTLAQMSRSVRGFQDPDEQYDNFADISGARRHTVVFVCISGGGARAATLGRHVMRHLEKTYNSISPAGRPLIDSIDAYSSVSGGSLFASHVALCHLRSRKQSEDRTEEFERLCDAGSTQRGTTYLGFWASFTYLSPGNLFLYPVMSVLTDWDYLHLLAQTLSITHGRPFSTRRSGYKLGELSQSPRFYFNCVCQETGSPFVITQSIIHLPGEMPREQTARERARASAAERLDAPRKGTFPPLRSALTLENINSSPAEFPLAYAAMASAAFPAGMDPLRLRKYAYRPPQAAEDDEPQRGKVVRTGEVLHVTDGGVYDNSGIATAVEVFEYLALEKGVRRLVVLAVNAATEEFDPGAATWLGKAFNRLTNWLPKPVTPVRGLFAGFQTVGIIHAMNKRRAVEASLARLHQIERRMAAEPMTEHDVHDWPGLCRLLSEEGRSERPTPGRALWGLLDEDTRNAIDAMDPTQRPRQTVRRQITAALNRFLEREDAAGLMHSAVPADGPAASPGDDDALRQRVVRARNRALLAAAYPRHVSRGVEFLFLPVSLSQLSPLDAFPLELDESAGVTRGELWRRLQKVKTHFVITPDDARVVERAARLILTADQSLIECTACLTSPLHDVELGWPVGPGMALVSRLDLAFAYAVVRAHLPDWDDEPQWRVPGAEAE